MADKPQQQWCCFAKRVMKRSIPSVDDKAVLSHPKQIMRIASIVGVAVLLMFRLLILTVAERRRATLPDLSWNS